MTATVRALSIMQPWCWLIAASHKDVENRTWATPYRGRVLLHAGKRHDGPRDEWDWPDIQPPARFDYGGIIGEAEIVGCVTESRSLWFQGPFGFVIRNARPLPFRPCRGQLGFFVPDFAPEPAPRQSALCV
ncbi:MAG TPA: ASCH domain-containing protein [Acetobacteraceae bacterium]|nr:ASCH domain-containing protein [Acetobacteraceae bacterium]